MKLLHNIKILIHLKCWFALFVLPYLTGNAQDTIYHTRSIDFSGYISSLQSAAFDNPHNPWLTSLLIHNRINGNASLFNEKIKLHASLRNRLSWADQLTNQPFIPANQSTRNGWINASFDLAKGQSYRLNVEFDRFYATYEHRQLVISAGRQRINWSQTFVWNPNDLFNAYSFYDLDYIERPGSDAIRFQYFPSEVSTIEAAVKIDHHRKITTGMLYRFNMFGYDIQLLGGILEESDYVAGIGWSGSLASSVSFRGEISVLHPNAMPDITKLSTLVAISSDYTFSSSLTLQGEYFFNQLAPRSFSQSTFLSYLISTGNIKTLSPARHNIMGQLSYPFTPLLNGSFAILFMPSIKGYYYAPSVSYSLAQNLDASLFWQSFAIYLDSTTLHYNLIMLRLKFYW